MNASRSATDTVGEETFLFPGRATDTEAGVLLTGAGDVTTAFIGLSARSETGQDADYIRWHQFDHVPEQFRIPGVRNGQRWVSTPTCRAARRAQSAPFDRVDHAVQYLFSEPAVETLQTFMDLGAALGAAGRQPSVGVPRVQSGAYVVVDKRVNPRGTLGAYALPWWPASGVYLTIEATPPDKAAWSAHSQALGELVALDGVAGAWRYTGVRRQLAARSDPEETVTVFYLYGDPVATAGPLGDLLEQQWRVSGRPASFAGPLQIVDPRQWDRYLP